MISLRIRNAYSVSSICGLLIKVDKINLKFISFYATNKSSFCFVRHSPIKSTQILQNHSVLKVITTILNLTLFTVVDETDSGWYYREMR